MRQWRKICCGIDFSEISRVAMDEAACSARTFGAELTLVHVLEEPPPGVAHPPAGEERRKARSTLDRWRLQAEFLADRRVDHELLAGDPAAELVRYAREGGFDVIVIGTCGRHGAKERLLGSVAEHVVRSAHCSVLAVRHRPLASVLGEGRPAAD